MKICFVCKLSKDESEFYLNNKRSGGLQNKCKACQQSYYKDYYKKNSEAVGKRTGKRRRANKKFLKDIVIDYLKTHPCVDCFETDIVVLEFDHLFDKKYNIANLLTDNCPTDRLLLEIAKCEVRCANCHKRKTAKEQGWYKGAINILE